MRTAVALVLATLVLVGPAAAEPAPKMAPKPAPKTAPEPSFNTPPDFPPDYRSKIARMMVKEYLREGKGRPQISEFRQGQGPLGASTMFCVRYPADVRFNLTLNQRFYHPSLPDRRDTRFVTFTGQRSLFSGGRVDFKLAFGPGITCEVFKQWMPFPELERAAAGQKRPTR